MISEPTTVFPLRTLSSKLKGVRGLGGIEGITRILKQFEELGLVQFLNNGREVALMNENSTVQILKTFCAACDLEGLQETLEPICTKGILFGSRATGQARTDSDYDLFVVTDQAPEVEKIITKHPLGKKLEIMTWEPDAYLDIERREPGLARKLEEEGIVIWGNSW